MIIHSRHSAVAAPAAIAAILLAGAVDAQAQQPDTLLRPPASMVHADTLDVIAAGYTTQLAQRRQMRLARPDTSLRASDEDIGSGVYRLEIDGLVVDETLTKLGRDFYDLFYRGWQAPPDAVNYTITLAEQPVPNLGTRVIVRVNDEVAFSANLQPRYEYIEAVARQALYYTSRALTNRRQIPMNVY